MKKIILLIALMFSTLSLYAQEPTPQPTQQRQPSAQELQEAKEVLKAIVEQDKPTTTGTPQQGKTVADVLDKGLESFSQFAVTLEGVVSKYAPEVWRIMILQQYSKAIGYPAFWGLMLLGIIIIQRIVRSFFGMEKGQSLWKPTEADTKNIRYSFENYNGAYWARVWTGGIIPLVFSVPVTIAFFYSLTESIMILINPEYYALRDIIGFLR
jgi:hypothetical protein